MVNKNGKKRDKKYEFSFGRLICERDIDNNKEICYTYDDSGNILTKSVNGIITDYRYEDGTDVGKYNYTTFGECNALAINDDGEVKIVDMNPICYRGYYMMRHPNSTTLNPVTTTPKSVGL